MTDMRTVVVVESGDYEPYLIGVFSDGWTAALTVMARYQGRAKTVWRMDRGDLVGQQRGLTECYGFRTFEVNGREVDA